jgi:pimeloyl-ACP methyl ester carboxylesterase
MVFYVFTLLTMAYLWLVGARRRRLQVGPVSLVYYRIGSKNGEPWVLLHGLGSVAASWGPVLRRLRRQCDMVVPELSSLGGTTFAGTDGVDGGGLGVRQGAEAAARLIETEFGGRPVTVVGISLGGWLAARLALQRPELVSRLVLVDAGGYRHQDWDEIERLVRVHDMAGIDELYRALFVKAPWIMRLSKAGFLKAYTSRAVTGVLDGLTEADTFNDDDLGRLRMPTALIWGEKDGLFRLDAARAMAAALPDATLQVLPGSAHAVHIEHPRRLAAALQRIRTQTSQTAPAVSNTPQRSPSSA